MRHTECRRTVMEMDWFRKIYRHRVREREREEMKAGKATKLGGEEIIKMRELKR